MVNESKKQKKRASGLWIRNEIMNNRTLNDSEKMLISHFDSFGTKGCYQSNGTLAKIFMTKPRTIRRRIAKINKAGLIYIKSPKGYYRTIWVRSNSEVAEACKLWYRGKEIGKPNGQKWPTKVDKTGQPGRKKSVFRHGQNCPTTDTDTVKETQKETKATPPPLPAGGQATALLEDRKAGLIAEVEQVTRNFGWGGRRKTTELTESDRRRWIQAQKKALLAIGAKPTEGKKMVLMRWMKLLKTSCSKLNRPSSVSRAPRICSEFP
jgi:hypothetical protein